MALARRFREASIASLWHLTVNLIVALLCALLVFGVWYPYPYGDPVGGRELFLLVVSVDVVCGPLLTLIVFDRRKPRSELYRDIGVVVLIQLAALGYGFWSVIHARPVFLAFEGNRFRVVGVPDLDGADLAQAPSNLQTLSLRGPRVISARLAKDTDPDFPKSVQLSMSGLHPAFRPERWQDYAAATAEVKAAAKPLSELRAKHKDKAERALIDEAVRGSEAPEQGLGYVPLIAGKHTDWVVLVSLADASVKGFLPLDGW